MQSGRAFPGPSSRDNKSNSVSAAHPPFLPLSPPSVKGEGTPTFGRRRVGRSPWRDGSDCCPLRPRSAAQRGVYVSVSVCPDKRLARDILSQAPPDKNRQTGLRKRPHDPARSGYSVRRPARPCPDGRIGHSNEMGELKSAGTAARLLSPQRHPASGPSAEAACPRYSTCARMQTVDCDC